VLPPRPQRLGLRAATSMTGPGAGGRPVALVTGAARGIGRAAALALAWAGYDVVINYSVSEDAAGQVADEARKLGAEAITAGADVADEAAVTAMVTAAAGRFGRPTRWSTTPG